MKPRAFYLGQRKKYKRLTWESKKPLSEEAQDNLHSVVVVFISSLLTHAGIYIACNLPGPEAILDSQGFTVGNHRSEVAGGRSQWLKEYIAVKFTPVIWTKPWCHR